MVIEHVVSQTFSVTKVLGKGIYLGQFNFCVLVAANDMSYVVNETTTKPRGT